MVAKKEKDKNVLKDDFKKKLIESFSIDHGKDSITISIKGKMLENVNDFVFYQHVVNALAESVEFETEMGKIPLKIRLHDDAYMPRRTQAGSYDLRIPKNVELEASGGKMIDTGIEIELLPGYEIQLRTLNGGIISNLDSTYGNTIKIPLSNNTANVVSYEKGTRLAKMVINRCQDIELVED